MCFTKPCSFYFIFFFFRFHISKIKRIKKDSRKKKKKKRFMHEPISASMTLPIFTHLSHNCPAGRSVLPISGSRKDFLWSRASSPPPPRSLSLRIPACTAAVSGASARFSVRRRRPERARRGDSDRLSNLTRHGSLKNTWISGDVKKIRNSFKRIPMNINIKVKYRLWKVVIIN